MDFTKFLAGSAVLGLIAGFWGRIKTVSWKCFNLLVQQVELLDDTTATAVVGHLIRHYRRAQLYDRIYGAAYEHTTDGKYGLIPYEVFGKRDIIFWNRWAPFVFTTGKGATPAGTSATPPGHNNQERGSPAKITFIRGTVDVEAIITAACHERNAVAWNVDYTNRQKVRRFFIRHVPALVTGRANTTGNGVTGVAWYQQSHYRLLQHAVEQMGKRVTSRKSPLEDLIFPRRIKELIQEIRLWRTSKEWYQERGIPWKRGWLCYGPPGTGKTALARAFAEELDMPIFVYNLGELASSELMKAWTEMQANVPCVALIEDIDNVFHGRENVSRRSLGSLLLPRKKKERGTNNSDDEDGDEARSFGMLSFDVLLNCLDGVERSDGVFTVITTNDIRKIDPALGQPRTLPDGTVEFISTRPGRIDKAVELTYMEPDDKKQMARRILGMYEDAYVEMLDFIERYAQLQETPAQFQERCAQIALRCFWDSKQEDAELRDALVLENV
jgi:DNA polymerase III delta prime subunit